MIIANGNGWHAGAIGAGRLMLASALGLTGCYAPHVINGQDALYCEGQGLRPGTDANFNCAMKREAERDQAPGHADDHPLLTSPAAAQSASPAHSGGVSQITPYSVAPGATETINFSISVNADCVFTGMPSVRIDKAPANGSVQVLQRIDFARLSQSGAPESCGDKKVSGISVEYKPNRGYIGPDMVQFAIVTVAGRTDFKVPITVEKPSQDE